MTDEEKVRSLMKLCTFLNDESKGCDTVGIIGGELFQDDKFFHEWLCLAETVRNADHIKRFFIGTHLMGDVDFMLDFCNMTGKEIQICTSYDTSGRFFGKDYDLWLSNIKKVQDEGYKVVVSTTITDAFIHDTDFIPPEGTEFKLQPIFLSEEWLEDYAAKNPHGEGYSDELRSKMTGLVKREDLLRWFREHPDPAREYSQYDGKHANLFWDYDRKERAYAKKDFVCSNYTSECGHPVIARCYADSDKCTMCDAKSVSE